MVFFLAWQSPLSRGLCAVQQRILPGISQGVKLISILPSLECELSSSNRAQGRVEQSVNEHTLAWTAHPLAEDGEEKETWVAQPHWTRDCSVHHSLDPLLLMLFSHHTGKHTPKHTPVSYTHLTLPTIYSV